MCVCVCVYSVTSASQRRLDECLEAVNGAGST